MTFISYAQNGEDVLLWRALGHLAGGFYIDVGANDPEEHSVTKAFYDAGWRGINIEPMPSYHQRFLAERPRDINLAAAAGAAEGSITLYEVPAVNGWASTDPATAQAHRDEGYRVEACEVPLLTLAGVCAAHVDGPVHFLKIDVEGFEGEVLRGMDFARWRPWIVVVEATLPNSRVSNHAGWEALVTGQGYRYAYFDGLNRYYVAQEHAELLAALTLQPNVFDAHISHHLDKSVRREQDCQRRAQELGLALDERAAELAQAASQRAAALDRAAQFEERAHAAEAALLQARQDALTVQAHADAAEIGRRGTAAWALELEAQLRLVQSSPSWRLTRPLRLAGRLAGLDGKGARLRGAGRALLRRLARQPLLRRAVVPLLARWPALDARVGRLMAGLRQGESGAAPAEPDVDPALRHLPLSARRVLADLQRPRTPS